jgi:hypothetical protein
MGTCQPSAALILCNKIIVTNYFGKKKNKAHIKMNRKIPTRFEMTHKMVHCQHNKKNTNQMLSILIKAIR